MHLPAPVLQHGEKRASLIGIEYSTNLLPLLQTECRSSLLHRHHYIENLLDTPLLAMQSCWQCRAPSRQFAAQTPVQSRQLASQRVLRAARLPITAMKTADGPSLAIVGVTGAVGQEFLRVSRSEGPFPSDHAFN